MTDLQILPKNDYLRDFEEFIGEIVGSFNGGGNPGQTFDEALEKFKCFLSGLNVYRDNPPLLNGVTIEIEVATGAKHPQPRQFKRTFNFPLQ